MRAIILIINIVVLMGSVDSQYPECVDCPDGSIPLSPLSYNTMRSNVFNGIQPSNEGCTNGATVSGQVTIDCGQGTTLIDCDRGYNNSIVSSDLSSYFIWSRNEAVGQQVSIVFRFYQQIKISRISMFFWNSQSNSIIVPNVRMFWSNYFDGSIILTNGIAITTNSPNRTGDGRRRLNIDINDNELQFQYLRIEINFNSEWVFLGEVQFCGNTAPYHITQPSTDNDIQIVSPTATMTSITCSLNITIPAGTIILWSHNGGIATLASNKNAIRTSHGTTLQIDNPQSWDAGVYQCVFNGIANDRWILRRNIRLLITAIAPSIVYPPNDSQVVTFTNSSSSVQLRCSLNVTIPSSMTVTWSHNGTATPLNKVTVTAGSTTTLVIRNPQPSDAGVYQCVFTDSVNGWMMRRNISAAIDTSTVTTTTTSTSTVTTTTTTTTSTSTVATTIASSHTTVNTVFTTSATSNTNATITTTINTTDTYSSITSAIPLLTSPTLSSSSSDDNNSSSVGVTVAIVVLVVVVLIITVVVIGIIVVWKEKKSQQHTKPEDVYYSTIDEITIKQTPKIMYKPEPIYSEVDEEQPHYIYMDIGKSADCTKADKVVMQDHPSYLSPPDPVKIHDNPAYSLV